MNFIYHCIDVRSFNATTQLVLKFFFLSRIDHVWVNSTSVKSVATTLKVSHGCHTLFAEI